ncbi:MAG: ABC transporter permease [Acutalibacteraceae bacterium]|jgi:NitT/TauT family transport system permease protein
MNFIMKAERKSLTVLRPLAVTLFWLGVWQLAFFLVKSELLLPSPGQTALRLFELMQTEGFWLKSLSSLLRIVKGFSLGVITGVVLGVLTGRFRLLRAFVSPALNTIKATPVASFIILALIWLTKDGVPVFISFLMVLPIIWSNVAQGIEETDKNLLEMARVFNFSRKNLALKVYLPSVRPYFLAGCTTALGFAWKAGIAAEILSLPLKSIGKELYNSKIYLETTDLFAWSVAVITLSIILEKLLVFLLGKIKSK